MAAVIFITDADNTLWDTNKVFTEAQLGLISAIQASCPQSASRLSFELLRKLDDQIAVQTGIHEYDFRILALALIYFQEGVEEKKAVSAATNYQQHQHGDREILAEEATQIFRSKLEETPPLLPTVSDSLNVLAKLKVQFAGILAVILHSEGDPNRVERIIRDHFGNQEPNVFDAVVITDRKSKDSYQQSKERGVQVLQDPWLHSQDMQQTIVVGDNISKDIEPGNLIGALTVYVPGNYKGVEIPSSPSQTPFKVVQRFADAIGLVEDLLAGKLPN